MKLWSLKLGGPGRKYGETCQSRLDRWCTGKRLQRLFSVQCAFKLGVAEYDREDVSSDECNPRRYSSLPECYGQTVGI